MVSIVIVNYNTRDILKKCIEHLLEILPGEDYDSEIIIVDNGSSDGSAQMVEESFSGLDSLHLIKSTNDGLAAGFNKGTAPAKGDYILYLGSDAFPESKTISTLVDYFKEHSDVGAATCKLVLRDGTIDIDAHRGVPTPWTALTHFSGLNKLFPRSKLFNRYFIGWENMDKPHEIGLCISHFLMMPKKVIEKVGEWDEDFFVYGEDVDYCYRIKQAGYKIMYLSQCKATHYKGVGVGIRKETSDISTASPETKLKMNKERTRAMRIFYKKHFSSGADIITSGIVLFGISILEKFRLFKLRQEIKNG